MTWFAFLPVLLVGHAVLSAPGAAVAWCLGQRGLRLLALAGPLSVSLIAVAALIAPVIAVGWSMLPVAVLTLIAAGSALLWRRLASRQRPRPARAAHRSRSWLPIAVGLAAAAVVFAFIFIRSVDSPEMFAQRYDNLFHLNAVRFVLDTGNASPLWVGRMTSPSGGLGLYPAAWHGVVSLIVQLTGASIPAATTATILVIGAVVWSLGAMLLARTLISRSWLVVVAASVLSVAFPAFPYLPLHYGVLYPLFLGLACVPAALAITADAVRSGRRAGRPDDVLLLILLVPGLTLAHPGAFLAWLALSIPLVVAAFVYRVRAARSGRWWWMLGLAAYAAAVALTVSALRPPANQIYWERIETVAQAVGEVLGASVYLYPMALALAVFLLAGIVDALMVRTGRRLTILAIAVVGATLYIVVAAAPSETLRLWLTGPWYNNSPRLASIWVIAALPLAVLGVRRLAAMLVAAVRRTRLRAAVRAMPVAVLILIAALALAAVTQRTAMQRAAADIEFTYAMRPDADAVSPDEYTLMERLDDEVPENAVIAGDPWTGTSFAYALSGRRVLMPHLLMEITPDIALINSDLRDAVAGDRVCDAVARTGVTHVLEFDGRKILEDQGDFSGVDDLADSPAVELIDQVGDARLFQVTGCRR